jgi:signal transduction histidine kinase
MPIIDRMETASDQSSFDHSIRSLSHDMGATFLLLENSFSQLQKSLDDVSCEPATRSKVAGHLAHADACLQQSKRFLDDLGRLAHGGDLEMDPSRVEPAAVVDQVLFEQSYLLAARNIRAEIRRPLPTVWCNEGRLKQIVTNLVRNAALHGCDPKHPQITVTAVVPRQKGPHSGLSGLRIHDNGPGIARQSADEIFLPGRRLHGSHPQGTGMGLTIVRKLADHYNGAAYVDPECLQGTAFVVVFPEQPAAGGTPGRNLTLDGRHQQRHRPAHVEQARQHGQRP